MRPRVQCNINRSKLTDLTTATMKLLLLFWSAVLIVVPVKCSKCVEVYQRECAHFFNGVGNTSNVAVTSALPWPSAFPNARGLFLTQVLREFESYRQLLSFDNYCSHLLHTFLCLHYFPPCVPTPPGGKPLPPVVPCRGLCEEAWSECLDFVYSHYELAPPEHLRCDSFPESATDFVACPTPAVHLDFCLPFGVKEYNVSESDGYLEVCIKLASTGSHKSLSASVEANMTFVDKSATGGVDYASRTESLVFPNGSVKGCCNHCFNITINDDLLIEDTEVFNIRVQVTEGTRFGGAQNRSIGQVAVKIHDDDVCFIPRAHCMSQCQQRSKASGSTFIKNNYTYAARIELLEVRHYDLCTAINARIIQCWNVKRRTCPPVNTSITIPTCKGCPKDDIELNVGDEYIIAGVRHKIQGHRRIILPSRKEVGLFGRWDNDRYSDIGDWVRRRTVKK